MVTRVAFAFFFLVFSALPHGTTSRRKGRAVDPSAAIAFSDPSQGFVFRLNRTQDARLQLDSGIASQQSNMPRESFTGDGQFNLDASLPKDFRPREGRHHAKASTKERNSNSTPTPPIRAIPPTFSRNRNIVASSSRKIQLGARITF